MKITMGDGTYSAGLSASVLEGKSESRAMDTFQKMGTRNDMHSPQESFDLTKMEKQLQIRLNNIERFKKDFPHLKQLPLR